VHIVVDKEIN